MTVIPFPSTLRGPGALSPREAGAGLTSSECFAIAAAARGLPGRWSVQWDEDDMGHASLTLLPNQDEAANDVPAFLVWREGGWLQLSVGQGELYTWLSAHADVDDVVAALTRSLDQGQPRSPP